MKTNIIAKEAGGKILDLIVNNIGFKVFFQKDLEPGYKWISYKGEKVTWNAPGPHNFYAHLRIGWKRRVLWWKKPYAVKIAVKIV